MLEDKTIWNLMTTCEHFMIFFYNNNKFILSHRDQSNAHHPPNSELSFIWLGVKRVGEKSQILGPVKLAVLDFSKKLKISISAIF